MSCCGVSPVLCLKLAATDAGTTGSMAHAIKSEHGHLLFELAKMESLWFLHAGANARVSASQHLFWLVSGAWVSPWGPRPSGLASCHSSPKAALRLKQNRLCTGPTTSCAAVHGRRTWLCSLLRVMHQARKRMINSFTHSASISFHFNVMCWLPTRMGRDRMQVRYMAAAQSSLTCTSTPAGSSRAISLSIVSGLNSLMSMRR